MRGAMKHAVLLGFLGLGLTACVNRGPERLEACLADRAFMPKYLSSTDPNRVMVAGMGAGGEVQCFWSQGDKTLSITTTSTAWEACRAQASDCTIMASGDRVLFNDRPYDLRTRPPGPGIGADPVGQVVWYLLGQFAQGLAMGVGAGIGAHLVGAVLAIPAAGPPGRAESAPREASYSPKPTTMCNPTGATIGGFPSYVCR